MFQRVSLCLPTPFSSALTAPIRCGLSCVLSPTRRPPEIIQIHNRPYSSSNPNRILRKWVDFRRGQLRQCLHTESKIAPHIVPCSLLIVRRRTCVAERVLRRLVSEHVTLGNTILAVTYVWVMQMRLRAHTTSRATQGSAVTESPWSIITTSTETYP